MTSNLNNKNTEPTVGDIQVTPEPARVKNAITGAKDEKAGTEPAIIEVETPSSDPVAAPEAIPTEKIQTDFREKLMNRSLNKDIFIPSNPASLEKAAAEVAKDMGFELNRGTSIGARLIARAQKRV
jgi:hypothetical protein